jgi:hypothetical protein
MGLRLGVQRLGVSVPKGWFRYSRYRTLKSFRNHTLVSRGLRGQRGLVFDPSRLGGLKKQPRLGSYFFTKSSSLFCHRDFLFNEGRLVVVVYLFNLYGGARSVFYASSNFFSVLRGLYQQLVLGSHEEAGALELIKAHPQLSGLSLTQGLEQVLAILVGFLFMEVGDLLRRQPLRFSFSFKPFFEPLRLTYFIQHQALDRKLRKIVKNRYRYVRRYVLIRPMDRLRWGLRLTKVCLILQPQRRWGDRVYSLLYDYIFNRDGSLLQRLWLRHQQVTLRALGLR